ncbi:MAG: MerR family DNA-binding transcriptional regulator [Thermodesulfobacteriota bacterium]
MPEEQTKASNFSISELARMLEVSPSTIRFYEDKGLILPKRTAGNQRIYSSRDKARMKLILRGKRFGFSLTEIAEMIGMADSPMSEQAQIEKSLKYIAGKFSELSQRKKELVILEQDLQVIREKLQRRARELKAEQKKT